MAERGPKVETSVRPEDGQWEPWNMGQQLISVSDQRDIRQSHKGANDGAGVNNTYTYCKTEKTIVII